MEQLESIQTKLETMKKDFEARIAELEQEIQNLRNNLELEKEANQKLNEKNIELKKENESLKEEIKTWKAKYEEEHKVVLKLSKENEKLQAEIVQLQNQLDEVHKNNPGFNPDALEEIYRIQDEMRSKIAALEEENSSLNKRVENLEKETVEMKDDMKCCINNVVDNTEEVDGLVRDVSKLKSIVGTKEETPIAVPKPGIAEPQKENNILDFYQDLE